MAFSTGDNFPQAYRNGAFVAFHGSWNRSPVQQGYNVVWIPFEGDAPTGDWEVFRRQLRRRAGHLARPGRQPAHGSCSRTGRIGLRHRLAPGGRSGRSWSSRGLHVMPTQSFSSIASGGFAMRSILLGAGLGSTLLLSGCEADPPIVMPQIVLGTTFSGTGRFAQLGTEMSQGYTLAVRMLNRPVASPATRSSCFCETTRATPRPPSASTPTTWRPERSTRSWAPTAVRHGGRDRSDRHRRHAARRADGRRSGNLGGPVP